VAKTAVSAQTHDVSSRLPGPDRVVKAIAFGSLRAAPDATDEHRNGGIPGHLQGFFFVIRATDIRVEADDKSATQIAGHETTGLPVKARCLPISARKIGRTTRNISRTLTRSPGHSQS
jgi:hypothetical protein